MKIKNAILICIGLLIITFIFLLVKEVLKEIPKAETNVTVIEKINDYNYILEDRDNKIYQDEFKILRTNLTSENINYEGYAKSIAKMFIIDFYTLTNKTNKYDIGGLEFLLSNNVENFKIKALDTIYKYLKDNSDKKRIQELPEIINIDVVNITSSTFKIDDEEYSSYIIELNWSYKEDYEYDNSAILTIINKDNKLYVVQEKRVES